MKEYLESQRGKTYTEIIENQPMVLVQGSLLKKHYQELKTILASGLRLHMKTFVADTAEKLAALTALEETFTEEYMADSDFKVNFTVPEVYNQYLFCIQTGALPQTYATALINLAKYEIPEFNITREVCANFYGSQWKEFNTVNSSVVFWLKKDAPEQTSFIIQHRDILPDGNLSDWRHSTAVHGVELIGEYQASLPVKAGRSYRWRCEYLLDCEVY
jgi:hypothetical protein